MNLVVLDSTAFGTMTSIIARKSQSPARTNTITRIFWVVPRNSSPLRSTDSYIRGNIQSVNRHHVAPQACGSRLINSWHSSIIMIRLPIPAKDCARTILTSIGEYKAIMAFLLFAPATPMLFQGQEFAASKPFTYFADHAHEPELAEAIANGRKVSLANFRSMNNKQMLETIPLPHDRKNFESCKLDFAERISNSQLYLLTKELLRVRREDRVFAHKRMVPLMVPYCPRRHSLFASLGQLILATGFSLLTWGVICICLPTLNR